MDAPASEAAAELLIDGARYGDVEDVEAALEQNVDCDARDELGRTGRDACSISFCGFTCMPA